MNRRIIPIVRAGLLVLVCSFATAASGATIQREFRYPSNQIHVRAGGIIEVDRSGATREFRPGRPDLPMISERVDLPLGLRVASVRVLDLVAAPLSDRVDVPSAMVVKPGLDEIERTPRNPEFFGRAGMQPASPVELSYQGFQRGSNLAWLRVSPVRWDAASGRLERVERLRVELVLEPAVETAVVRERVVPEWEDDRLMRSPGQLFETGAAAGRKLGTGAVPLASQPGFEASELPSVLGSPVAYVIVTNDSMASEFQRLADWKTQTGVPAVVRTLATIRQQYPNGSDDADRVRQFIRDAYARWGTKWVLLGGDVDILPTRLAYTTFYGSEHIACDMYFSCLDGNWNANGNSEFGEGFVDSTMPGDGADLLPDVWVGRAPVSTRSDAQLFVNKTLQYTKTPVGDYENSVLYFAEVLFPQHCNPGDFISLDGAQLAEETLPYLRSHAGVRYTRLYENYTDTRWEPGSYPENKQAVIDSLDRGYNVSVHIGHGYRNVMAVGNEQNLVNADAEGLTNGNRLTNMYSINCTSSAIDFSSIGEAFLLAPNGGAVTNIGSTRLDFPSAGRVYQKEYFKLLYEDSVTAVGEAQARQKLPFVGYSAGDNVNRWMQFTLLLLGDPELRIYTALPRTLTVTHPGSILVSDSTLSVTVKVGTTPLPGARVVAYKAGDEYRIGTTDNSGVVVLPFRPDSLGGVTLTVTAYDARPYQAQVMINAAVQPVLAERTPVIDDDNSGGTIGNVNGLLDSGETIDVKIQVKNNGSSTASTVNGTLSTTDPNVTVTQPAVSYGSILAGTTTTVLASYRIVIPVSAPDDRELSFNLRLADDAGRSWNERIALTNHAAILRHNGESVLDAGGNSNGRPEPGETVQYLVKLKNLGTGPASSVTAKLRSWNGLSLVTDSTATWGTISPGEEKTADAMTFVPSSGAAVLELRVSTSQGLLFTKLLDLSIPATPQDLSGVGSTSSIALTWTPSTEPALLGYHLYRSSSAGGPFTRLTAIPTERTAYYVDGGLATLTRYFYQVAAVDSSCNESNLSAAVPFSTNPPNHAFFPMPLALASQSSVAIEHIWSGYPLSIVSGSEEVLYAWNPDGSAPVDADGSIATSGDFTRRGFNYRAPASVADLDGDGFMDIVASSWDSLSTFAFTRTGQVRAGWPVTTTDPVWSAAAIADLDNDGKKEVVFGSNGKNIYAFRWNGTEVRDGDGIPATKGVFIIADVPFNFSTPAIADIDGDGFREVVITAQNGWIYAINHNGTSPAGWNRYLGSAGAHIYASAAIGNLDGTSDTELDIVIPIEKDGGLDSIHVLRANGQKKPGWPKPASIGGMDLAPSPALADMNNDGKLDVVYAGTDGRLYVYAGSGTALALNGVRFSTLMSLATESSPVVADINGDGLNDVVIGDELGYLTAISGDGTVLPGFPILLGAEVKSTPALCDCDGDGKTEIVFSGMDQKVYVWDYDFPFSPNGSPPWPQFHHDAARTGFAGQLAWTGVDDQKPPTTVRSVEFAAPWPNPAPGATRISWAIPADRAGDPLEVAVFDLSGRKVRVLERGQAQHGRHTVGWDLRDGHGARVEAGVFFVKFALGTDARSQKLVVLR